jgi:predicted DNA-binding transcriptional regulator AlpA
MSERSYKKFSTRTNANQFDLFAVHAARPAGPCDSSRQAAAPTPKPTDDSLMAAMQYVAGRGVGSGRPAKLLPLTAASSELRLLDVREAARRLGLSKSTLDKMRCAGTGPRFIRATARAVRYDPADLDAFANARRRTSTMDDALSAITRES